MQTKQQQQNMLRELNAKRLKQENEILRSKTSIESPMNPKKQQQEFSSNNLFTKNPEDKN